MKREEPRLKIDARLAHAANCSLQTRTAKPRERTASPLERGAEEGDSPVAARTGLARVRARRVGLLGNAASRSVVSNIEGYIVVRETDSEQVP